MSQPEQLPISILRILESVMDPEIPVLNVLDLGVINDVAIDGNQITIQLIPTYSGCPAMDVIGDDLVRAFATHGYTARIQLVLSPPWTTDRITDRGRLALQDYGIAPPLDPIADKEALLNNQPRVSCTHCGSIHTELISQFGSTACKAMFKCMDCHEPFDYFKCLK